MKLTTVEGIVTSGHGVASGMASDSPYPQGTIALQTPVFQQLGLDLSPYYPGTINLNIAPYRFKIRQPDFKFEDVQWIKGFPPESFSFVRCQVVYGLHSQPGWMYYPHPETKIGHFQSDSILEIITGAVAAQGVGEKPNSSTDGAPTSCNDQMGDYSSTKLESGSRIKISFSSQAVELIG